MASEIQVEVRNHDDNNNGDNGANNVNNNNGVLPTDPLDISQDIFNKVCSDGLHVNMRLYNTMINGLCQEGLLDEANDLMRKIEQDCFSPDSFTYDFILQGFLRRDKLLELVLLDIIRGCKGIHDSIDNRIRELERKIIKVQDIIAGWPNLKP
ncbi:hypothetical protein RND71_001530 [Anisodus tanguticus]|uniref:Uncharacterized protein n=1 Tax=Anisodus tanguticus TaxID=243964 RepID=A0AAE1T1L3_9SOLA|nr:hypothetical protein RND71_001530 [Anisodus tanguticus]